MITLATIAWTAYMYVGSSMNMRHNTPPPIIIESGETYNYAPVESALYVPHDWTASCDNQKQMVYWMGVHFNNFRNGNRKVVEKKLTDMKNAWVCLDDNS